jgi:hypothetical protein
MEVVVVRGMEVQAEAEVTVKGEQGAMAGACKCQKNKPCLSRHNSASARGIIPQGAMYWSFMLSRLSPLCVALQH